MRRTEPRLARASRRASRAARACGLAVALALAGAACDAALEDPASTERAVINGAAVSVPYFALINASTGLCSGAALDERHVLTAKHCTDGASDILVGVEATWRLASSVQESVETMTEGELALIELASSWTPDLLPTVAPAFPAGSFRFLGRLDDGALTDGAFAPPPFACTLSASERSCFTATDVAEHGDSGGPLVAADATGGFTHTIAGAVWGGVGSTSFHTVTTATVASLRSRPPRALDHRCETRCAANPAATCFANGVTTTCALLPPCGFGCTIVGPETPGAWTCMGFSDDVLDCVYGMTCAELAAENFWSGGGRCETGASGACGGIGPPTTDCDHCCQSVPPDAAPAPDAPPPGPGPDAPGADAAAGADGRPSGDGTDAGDPGFDGFQAGCGCRVPRPDRRPGARRSALGVLLALAAVLPIARRAARGGRPPHGRRSLPA